MCKCDIGIYGLGIMGQNLALNLERNGFSVSVFNRIEAGEERVVDDFISNRCHGKKIILAGNENNFINNINPPRKIIVLVKAGAAVDEVIERLIPFLEVDDIIIDGGNSHYKDTARRILKHTQRGLLFIGCGISGGSDGALNGPSMMPGGSLQAWEKIKSIFQKIAAKSEDGAPCCDWIGPEGSGHFVKMVHNGVEYALMQVLAESFDVMKRMLSMSIDEINCLFSAWNEGALNSYLLEITINILKIIDKDGQPLVENMLDCAEQKGTGKDIAISALELGVPVTAISEALNARFISCMINERRCASKEYVMPGKYAGDKKTLLKALHDAVYCSEFIAYAQGFSLIARASVEYNWNLDPVKIARIWRSGCIIQSNILNDIMATHTETGLENILLQPYFIRAINRKQINWRYAIITAIQHGIPIPSLSSSLSYFDSFRSERLPANLIQAQRDYFGAHGFERVDARRGIFFNIERGKKQ
jgi:6-phosphogluconate dehydrogenase